MGFYDVFRADCASHGMLAKDSALRILRDATVVRAHNVMDYYATEIADTGTFRKQLGRLVPPWPVLWMEVAAPKQYRVGERVISWPPFGFTQAGVLLHTVEWPLDAPGLRWRLIFTSFFDIPIIETPKGTDWVRYPYVMGRAELDIDGYVSDDRLWVQRDMRQSEQLQALLDWNQMILQDVLLLALSFCNCRNVVLPETVPARRPPNKRERRQHITPQAERRFHSILIEPLRVKTTQPSSAGTPTQASATPSTPHALHIVRGHFSTYTKERPLFGNPDLHGQFWIPQHLRGAAASGQISADYEIRLAQTATVGPNAGERI